MKQNLLFQKYQHPMARTTDPKSSHNAAAKHRNKAESNRQHVAALVQMSPGLTSKELAEIHAEPSGLDRHEIARRLPECEARKMVIAEGRGSGKELKWFPTKEGGDL